jgi:hypothetical protein
MAANDKNKVGRPSKCGTPEEATGFGKIGATYKDIARFYGVDTRTVQRWMSPTEDGRNDEFRLAYEKGYADRNVSLRRKQTEVALAGNVPMLKWLGVQDLEQRDKQETEHTGLVNFTFDKQDEEA